MSQSDSFIEEVTEEVRREKLFTNMKRYGWIAVVLVLAIVAGAAWYEYSRSQNEAKAEAFGDSVLTALEQGEPAERATALGAIDGTTPQGEATKGLLEAAELASSGDQMAAVAVLNSISENMELPVLYRSIAQFRALALQSDTLTPAERRDGYDGLAGAGSPLRLLAMEQIAVTYVEEGDRDEALSRLNSLMDEAGASADLLRRVSQLIVSLGGTLGETSN